MDDSTAVESSSFQSQTNDNMDTTNDNSSFNFDNSYIVPLPIDESSIQEHNDDPDFPVEEVSVNYTINTGGTTRARDKLVDTVGFSYTRKNPPVKATQYWCCYIRGKFVFATGKQFQLLARCKIWYMDGTFKLVKNPFINYLAFIALSVKMGI